MIKEQISEKFRQLINEGDSILESTGWDGHEYHAPYPSKDDFFRFKTEMMNLVRRSCGEESDHYRELKRLTEGKDTGNNSYYMPSYLGVARAAQSDFESGLLFDLRTLIAAELLGDFLKQAEVLLQEGYHVPAASLAGAILEDTLRKLCEAHAVPVAEKTNIEVLNADLARARVYNKLIQKRITAFADIRNNADHGHFDKFNREDVEDFVKWLRRFSADYWRKAV